MLQKSQFSPLVQQLWSLVESRYKRPIRCLPRPISKSGRELASRISPDGTPGIFVQPSSVINDMSVSHELLHLWRWGCGVPVVNTSPDKSLELKLSDVQNHFEHLWIYTMQEAPPFNMKPWNTPHSEAAVSQFLRQFSELDGVDLSWPIACDVQLSRPLTKQVYRQRVSEQYPDQIQKMDQILKAWKFEHIDTPDGSAATFLKVLEAIGFDIDEIGLMWQTLDESGELTLLDARASLPTGSLSGKLAEVRGRPSDHDP